MSELLPPSSPSPWRNMHLIPNNDDVMNKRNETHVTVIGAGFIGISTAYFLNNLGYKVTVIDKKADCGLATSHACGNVMALNRAWPIAQPQQILPALRNAWNGWFFSKNGKIEQQKSKTDTNALVERPLIFDKEPPQNRLMVPTLRWGYNYIDACRPNAFKLGSLTIYSMAVHSQIMVQNIIDKYKMPLEIIKGHTCLYTHPDAFKHDREIYHNLEVLVRSTKGFKDSPPIMEHRYEILSSAEALDRVPILRNSGVNENMVVGGLYSPFSLTTSAHAYLVQLEKICKQNNINFKYNTEIVKVVEEKKFFKSGQITKLITKDNDSIDTDFVIFCTGPETQPLLKSLNIKGHVPIIPLVGHSLTTVPSSSSAHDNYSFSIMPQGLYINQVNNEIRMTQGADLGVDIDYHDPLCDYLLEGFRKLYQKQDNDTLNVSKGLISKGERVENKVELWAGGRPLTPDTRPIIGFLPQYNNVMINSGHGMLGWTLSAISGELSTFILDSRVNNYENNMIGPRTWIKAVDPCRFMLYYNFKNTIQREVQTILRVFRNKD